MVVPGSAAASTFKGAIMRRVTFSLPDELYSDLQELAAATREHGYGPAQFAGDVVAAELASRRLSRVTLGSHGARIGIPEADAEPEGHRILWPEKVGACG